MDSATLEGYLVALLVWPVGLPPGGWLPPIWGERGWKVPAKIASLNDYQKFTELVVSFLHELDLTLGVRAPRFTPTLFANTGISRRTVTPGIPWAQGFLKALQQNSQGMAMRSSEARSAVTFIASCASLSRTATNSDADVAADITSAVLALARERPTRGPLGALVAPKPFRSATVAADS